MSSFDDTGWGTSARLTVIDKRDARARSERLALCHAQVRRRWSFRHHLIDEFDCVHVSCSFSDQAILMGAKGPL